jgi:hypothetical protein
MADGKKVERKKANGEQGTCRLCGAESTLIDSHIIPRWTYKNISDGRQNAVVHIDQDSTYLSTRQHKEYLLCQDCESMFGKCEDYVARIAPRRNGSFRAFQALRPLVTMEYSPDTLLDASLLDCEKIDYFAASMLWRAAASEYKFGVQVAVEEEVALRHYLLGRTDSSRRFCLVVEALQPGGAIQLERAVLGPQTVYWEQDYAKVHQFLLLGFIFVFFPDYFATERGFWEADLLSTRRMTLGRFRPFCEDLFLRSAAMNPRGKLANMYR